MAQLSWIEFRDAQFCPYEPVHRRVQGRYGHREFAGFVFANGAFSDGSNVHLDPPSEWQQLIRAKIRFYDAAIDNEKHRYETCQRDIEQARMNHQRSPNTCPNSMREREEELHQGNIRLLTLRFRKQRLEMQLQSGTVDTATNPPLAQVEMTI